MIKVNYTELDGPAGPTCRLEASGHAGYAPAGQDIVCAGASTLMQTLCALLAGEEGTKSGAWDEPDGPRLAVTAAAPQKPWVDGFVWQMAVISQKNIVKKVSYRMFWPKKSRILMILMMTHLATSTMHHESCRKALPMSQHEKAMSVCVVRNPAPL